MNKFLIAFAAVVACSCVVLASPTGPQTVEIDPEHIDEEMTQFAAFADDDGEVAKLPAEKALFKDFCLTARDDVKGYLKETANSKASDIFTFVAEIFASTSNKVGAGAAQSVENGEKLIKEDARSAKMAVTDVLGTIARIAKGEFTQKIAALKEELNGEKVIDAVENACNAVSMQLAPQVEQSLSAYKKDLAKSSQAAEFASVIKETKLNNLGCQTTGRLSVVSRGCKLLGAVFPTLREYFE